jgi:hypothetical protein
VSRRTVTVLGVAPSGRGRDQRMSSGASILASVSALISASHRKAEVVYSADCSPRVVWNVGYRARPAQQF